jgi:STE24 endopeptidase
VERPALIERLGALSRRLRVPIASIDELVLGDTSAATALVAGTGQARRVFIGSELIRDWSDEEVAVVVAHEMAHHAQHHLWQTAALDGVILSLGFWAAERALATPGAALAAGDLTALPRIALVVGAVWLAFTPVRHALSRHHERRADLFALELTGSVAAFRTALRRLAERHLAEERPSRLTRWFHHRHPTVAERLALADRFQSQIDR